MSMPKGFQALLDRKYNVMEDKNNIERFQAQSQDMHFRNMDVNQMFDNMSNAGLRGAQGAHYGAQTKHLTDMSPLLQQSQGIENKFNSMKNQYGEFALPYSMQNLADAKMNGAMLHDKTFGVTPEAPSTESTLTPEQKAWRSASVGHGVFGLRRGTARVPGKGSGDKVPAMLEPGEAVVAKDAIKHIPGGRKAIAKANAKASGKTGLRGGVLHASGGEDEVKAAEWRKLQQLKDQGHNVQVDERDYYDVMPMGDLAVRAAQELVMPESGDVEAGLWGSAGRFVGKHAGKESAIRKLGSRAYNGARDWLGRAGDDVESAYTKLRDAQKAKSSVGTGPGRDAAEEAVRMHRYEKAVGAEKEAQSAFDLASGARKPTVREVVDAVGKKHPVYTGLATVGGAGAGIAAINGYDDTKVGAENHAAKSEEQIRAELEKEYEAKAAKEGELKAARDAGLRTNLGRDVYGRLMQASGDFWNPQMAHSAQAALSQDMQQHGFDKKADRELQVAMIAAGAARDKDRAAVFKEIGDQAAAQYKDDPERAELARRQTMSALATTMQAAREQNMSPTEAMQAANTGLRFQAPMQAFSQDANARWGQKDALTDTQNIAEAIAKGQGKRIINPFKAAGIAMDNEGVGALGWDYIQQLVTPDKYAWIEGPNGSWVPYDELGLSFNDKSYINGLRQKAGIK